MIETLHTVLAFVFAIALLVAVHEYGHFIVARKLGIKVEKFSIGFGPSLLSWRSKDKEVEYVIAAIPLGGYVKMLGENTHEEREEPLSEADLARAYDKQPVWKRASVAFAGPLFNFVFAVFAYMCVGWIGQTVMPPVIGSIEPASVAERAGLLVGDQIERVNGHDIYSWQSFEEALKNVVDSNIQVDLSRDGQALSVTMPVKALEKDALLVNVAEEALGISFGMRVFIDSVAKASPAEKAGLLAGDEIVQVDGSDIGSVRELIRVIQSHAGKPLMLGILRSNINLQLQVIPKADSKYGTGRLGVHLTSKPLTDPILYRMGLWEGVTYGFTRTAEMTVMTIKVMGKMITTAISPENLGGPIAIAQLAGRTADLGVVAFITFLALISVNLGVLNLLPIPVLDGGHLVYLGLEKLRGKPLSEVVLERMQLFGIVAIAILMVFAFYNDLMRLFRG
jgi:regulator of sigma E protease